MTSCLDVFEALSPDVPLALVPQENTTHGYVVETYDLLRSPRAGKEIFVRGEAILTIKHSLVVKKGVNLEDIENVLSHAQVTTFLCIASP